MKLTIRVRGVELLTTAMVPDAHIVVTFSGLRWFGFRISVSVKDARQHTSLITTPN